MNPLSIKEVIDSPTVSYWLKDALKSALTRDPVDAVNDAELLVLILKDRMQRLLGAEVQI